MQADNRNVRVVIVASGICVFVGLVVTFTVGSLIGHLLLVFGAVCFLIAVLPPAFESLARLLTTGLRR